MQTMHPAIVAGQHTLELAAIDPDVFAARRRQVDDLLEAGRYGGLVIYGDAQDSSVLTYLTNYMPRMRWAVALLSPGQPLRLYVAGPARDLPFVRDMTTVDALHPFEVFEQDLAAWADGEPSCGPPRLAGCNLERARDPVALPLSRVCAAEPIDSLDAELERLAAACTPLVRAKVAGAHRLILDVAQGLARESRRGPVAPALAAMDFERRAYEAGAYQVQTLFGDGASLVLEPFDGHGDPDRHASRGVLYAALKVAGYAADAFVCLGPQDDGLADIAKEILAAVREQAQPGVSVASLRATVRLLAGRAGAAVFDDALVAQLGLRIVPLADASVLSAARAYSLKLGVLRAGMAYFASDVLFLE